MPDPNTLNLSHDDLIDQINARAAEEYARASEAGESGALVADFLEKTNMNSQAFSWCKSIVKKMPKKDGQAKALDIIRSLQIALPMIKAHVEGQTTAEMFPDDDDYDPTKIEPGPHNEDSIEQDAADFEASDDDAITPVDFGSSDRVAAE